MAQVQGRARRFVVLMAVLPIGLLLVGTGAARPASAAVSSVSGNAYGYFANVTVVGMTQPPVGPTPTVTLPPGGSATPVTATAPTGSVIAGPAQIFSSGPISVSTQGTPGPTGSATSTTSIATVNTSDQEAFTASNVTSTCTASEAGKTGSTTITGGTLYIDSGLAVNNDDDYTDPGEHPPVIMPVPVNPAPNTTFEGHIHVGNATDTFRYVFNEQVTNPDGSLTVRAGHQYLLGPLGVGELIFGQSTCGAQVAAAPTFAPVSPARVWDTRFGPGPTGRVGPGATRDVTVTGVGGVPATGVTAVVLNVTAVNPTAATFVTAWPTGEAKPLASNLNVPPNDVRPNLVIVKVGAGGQVSFNNFAGDLDLIADVAGWYGPAGA